MMLSSSALRHAEVRVILSYGRDADAASFKSMKSVWPGAGERERQYASAVGPSLISKC